MVVAVAGADLRPDGFDCLPAPFLRLFQRMLIGAGIEFVQFGLQLGCVVHQRSHRVVQRSSEPVDDFPDELRSYSGRVFEHVPERGRPVFDEPVPIGFDELVECVTHVRQQPAHAFVDVCPCTDLPRQVTVLDRPCAQDDRVHVRLDQRLVVEKEPGRGDLAGDDPIGSFEEVLVMRRSPALCRAERDHRSRLRRTAGAALPLGIVRRGGRDIAHVHRGECADVDTEFHGGSAHEHFSGSACSRNRVSMTLRASPSRLPVCSSASTRAASASAPT